MAVTVMTMLAGAVPALAVPPTMRLTVSPVLKRRSSPGPQPRTWLATERRSHAVAVAVAVPVASVAAAPLNTVAATSAAQMASHLTWPSACADRTHGIHSAPDGRGQQHLGEGSGERRTAEEREPPAAAPRGMEQQPVSVGAQTARIRIGN